MNNVPIEQYKHLENICSIQQRFICGEIKTKEFLKELDNENQRYLLELKNYNQKIKQELSIEKLVKNVKDYLTQEIPKND